MTAYRDTRTLLLFQTIEILNSQFKEFKGNPCGAQWLMPIIPAT
jgi:hypothetical protein